ncbi:aminoacyl-tRNA hydrolase [Rickettsiella grylli]|uniref:Peptidyl-tRNA hydrolase n=1 Tax=Rickettsiella grylli TaxID=59196 RepID=A8PMR3_9COXI|nr:aminoacyl-tRNA hydrolase [Rickettsiella grylli]EDP45926.1 peptidyl-tRNA hydrolase [Rickettsiella grylli]
MSSHPIQLIAGLANPGKDYAKSRHNAGAWLIETLLQQRDLTPLKRENKFHALISAWSLSAVKCWILIPTTFMNESGRAIKAIAHFYHIPVSAILIVHDDLDLLPGIARYKHGGGDGGHNGLKDIMRHLQSKDFWRLRLGIGHPGHRDKVHHYVLSSPSIADKQRINQAIEDANSTLRLFAEGQPERAMHVLHTQQSNR